MLEPGEAASLQKWIARHPRQINQQYGAFCATLLHVAAQWGREDIVDMLIAAGADVEASNKLDERPLNVAAQYGRPTVVKRLLFFFSSRRRHTRCSRDWSSDVCSSD